MKQHPAPARPSKDQSALVHASVDAMPDPHTSPLGPAGGDRASSSSLDVGKYQEEKSPNRLRALPALTDETGVRRVLGFDGNRCPLPGHRGDAELVWHRGELRLECDCKGRSAEWDRAGRWRSLYNRSLSDAYWLVKTGEVAGRGYRLKKGYRLVSQLLLTHELGLIGPMPVVLPELPPGATELDRQVAAFFVLLYGLRLAHDAERVEAEGITFTDRLLVGWFGVDRREARAAINALRDAKVIDQVDRTAARGPYLWKPAASVAVHREERASDLAEAA